MSPLTLPSPRFLKSPAAVIATVALAFISPFAAVSEGSAAETAPVQSIEFLGETYSLAWCSDPVPNYSKAEYLPEGEELPYYTNMILVERVGGIGVTDAVRAQVQFLQDYKKSKEAAGGAKILNLIENPSTGEVLLLFVMSAPDEEHEVIWEWNAYRYSPVQTDDGQEDVRLFGYSRRHYGNDESVYDFLEEIDVDNPYSEAVNAVATAQVP